MTRRALLYRNNLLPFDEVFMLLSICVSINCQSVAHLHENRFIHNSFETVTACHLSGLLSLGRSTEERIYLPVNITFNRTHARLFTESKKCIPGIFLYQRTSRICIHSRPLKMKQVSLEDQVLLTVFGQYYPLLKFLGLTGNS